MTELPYLLHYASIALTVSISSLGVAIGEGLTSKAAIEAINKQPSVRSEIARLAILGMALIETAAILGVLMAIMLLVASEQPADKVHSATAKIGIILAICLSSFVIGIVSSFPAQAACQSVARQPFFSQKITRFMLITQSIIQTPMVFSFIIAVFIKNQAQFITNYNDSLRLIASGLCIGLGSIGPSIGLANFARSACKAISINRSAYNQLLSFTFLSQAIIESSIIFSLLIAITLITTTVNPTNSTAGIATLAAGLCMGIGTFGPGIASGKMASIACTQIALDPSAQSRIARASIFGQGLIDTFAIYALLVSFLIIYFR